MTKRTPIALCGLMGAGKTSLGRALAQQLGLRFVDADARIEEHAGASISEIFRKEGESAFRMIEERVAVKLSNENDCVVALGGGAMHNPKVRNAWLRRGIVIFLNTDIDLCLERIKNTAQRPLLKNDPRAVLKRQLSEREASYRMAPIHIDNNGAIEDALLALQVPLDSAFSIREQALVDVVLYRESACPILTGHGAFDSLPEVLVSTGTHAHAQLIVHAKELRAHAMGLCAAQKQKGVNAHTFEVSGDESCKTFEVAEKLLSFCAEKELDRSSVIIAIGGGATTDLAGFVAATYMRGIDLVMVPTTLLAMCDASVGGKCAINLASGKNLVGAFHFAKAVIVDSMFLDTLPMSEIKAGLAEIVKHALLGDRQLYERLLDSGFSASAQNLSDAVAVKRRIVERDPFEKNERMLLNLGHTFAHAFEKLSNYTLSHGHCVAVGLSAAAKLSAECGFLQPEKVVAIDALLKKLRLPNKVRGASIADIIAAMQNDKKHRAKTQRFIGLRDIAEACVIEDPSLQSLENAIAHVMLSEADDIVLDCTERAKA